MICNRSIVRALLCATCCIDFIFLKRSYLCKSVIPVCCTIIKKSVRSIILICRVIWIMTSIDSSSSSIVDKLCSCKRTPVVIVNKLLSTILSPCCKTSLTSLTALCCNEDDTVCCTRSVNRSGCCILKNSNRLNVIRIQEG